ncbi:MAG: class II fumarate hydratase, partial [Erysipelotrichaceae bacterium]|nr:class II fumarate hydratase [Erysipelotrichaceae bacterium]
MKYRREKDSLGEVLVDADHLWGAQTQRSLENFRIGTEKMPAQLIEALVMVKKACAEVNGE